MKEHFDKGSLVIIAMTFLLFVAALFTKGLTQEMLLEAGILLVSIKLIGLGYSNSVATKKVSQELAVIRSMLEENRPG